MKVKIKKLHPNAVIPTKAHETDAGMDLVVTSKRNDDYGNVVYGCGLAMEIPKGYAGFIFPRSSNSKKNLLLTNAVGVIDSGYRGEIMAKFMCTKTILTFNSLYHRLCLLLFGKRFMERLERSKITNASLAVNNIHVKDGEYQIGERFAQIIIMPYPSIEFEEADSLSDSDRGEGGYGSSGK